ncbi:MAG: NAD(P)H-dependent glycerol-3-phosphate dehydrogenase [Gemmatimonadaceae bacterium]|nr:NAD(P)H-dependent glycerol-3-phosphate dehydrogenase [Gloeobacterales cyanobacterium ES-bin-141]
MKRFAVLGAGAWGKTLASLIRRQGHPVKIWSRSGPLEIAEVLHDVEVVVSCLPIRAVGETVRQVAGVDLPAGTILVSTTKGLDSDTVSPASACWQHYLPHHPMVVLSGPNLAAEVLRGLPAATVVAGTSEEATRQVQQCLATEHFRVYTSSDLRGVELGGVLKNVIAIAAGVSDGLELGANAKASLITRGLAEMIRVGTHWGGQMETFYGLSGLGDLLTTCNSTLSRNYQIGYALGQGKTLALALNQLQGTAEGVYTTPVLVGYAQRVGLEVPIADQVCALLNGERPPVEALMALMSRRLREESH